MPNLDRFFQSILGSVGITLIALVLGYLWARAMHYPFTVRQRKMLTYYALFLAGACVLNPVFVAMVRLWRFPLNESAAVVIFLLLIWLVIVFYIVRGMSRPGGRLSEEPQQ
jgi:hypothetical protein